MMRYIDSHCHMDSDCVPRDGGGADLYVCNAVRESDWGALINAAHSDSRMRIAIGIHPWRVMDVAPGWDVRMRKILHENPNVMVGEIGVDAARRDTIDAQIPVFLTGLDIAREYNRTAHIHCVRASDVILRGIRDCRPPRVVMHAFSGGVEFIRGLIKTTDVYFSYSDMIVRRPSRRLTSAIADTPLDRILVESDTSPCHSADIIPHIINAIAKIKNLDNNMVSEIIYDNATRMLTNG